VSNSQVDMLAVLSVIAGLPSSTTRRRIES
jgi:hypothetical protein